MSGGRLTLGVGYGWNPDELVNHGHEWKHRRAIVREHVELMRALWTETEAEYHGEFANLERSWSWPKPAQPSIPVLLGAAGRERAHGGDRRVGRRMDAGRFDQLDRRPARGAAAAMERSRTVRVGPDRLGHPGRRRRARSSARRLERLAALDVEEVVIAFDTVERDEILPVLDRYEKVIAANAG